MVIDCVTLINVKIEVISPVIVPVAPERIYYLKLNDD